MYSCEKAEADELLKLELALDTRDLRAHAWYHGSITRPEAEQLLESDGDFLVRDCTSSSHQGDFVLSCRWRSRNLHFLVLKDILQPDTIYEKFTYRFENESFDTVSDLITYHVGSGIPISVESGAVIGSPKTRTAPIIRKTAGQDEQFGVKSLYVSLMKAGIESINPDFSRKEKVSTLDRMKQKSLNLEPPPGLLEELNEIPSHIAKLIEQNECTENVATSKQSNFDLTSFQSILLPTDCQNNRMDKSLLKIITDRFLETSDRLVALHLTKTDWDILRGKRSDSAENFHSNLYSLFFHNSQHRWNNIIERSLTLSYFVMITIHYAENLNELIFDKWIRVASELKAGLGNFFSFCSIIRGLLMPQIAKSSGKVDWMKLRTDFTTSTFNFETTHRTAYQNLVKGVETYSPNCTIPELYTTALILENSLEMLSVSCINSEENQIQFFSDHLKCIRNLVSWRDVQKRNMERNLKELENFQFDVVLSEMFQTEFLLILIWGADYQTTSMRERSNYINSLV